MLRKRTLLCILMLACLGLRGDPAGKNWNADPEWIKTRYGAWGGPGVDSRPGANGPTEVRVWGRRRLLILERLLPRARRVRVFLLGTGLPTY